MANAEYQDFSDGSRRKVALVIGNSNYALERSLPNTINDAKQMTIALRRLGFHIHDDEPKLDLTYREFSMTLMSFVCSIDQNDLVLFYFSGHGTQQENENYLIPVDDFKEENKERVKLDGTDLKRYAINAQQFLNNIDDRNPFAILFFLDCCRTYHLKQERSPKSLKSCSPDQLHGLKSMSPKIGSLIAFACAPGTTADDGNNREKNGLFTKHLLKHLSTTKEDVIGILMNVTDGVIQESNSQQIPHVTFVLTKKIFLCNENQRIRFNRWTQDGVTIAGGNGRGEALNQLNRPHGICIDKNNNTLVADWGNDRIMKWKPNGKQGEICIDRIGNLADQLTWPRDVIVDEQNCSLIIGDWGNRRVIQWWNHDLYEVLVDDISCSRLTMDKYGFLYISDWEKHEVRRWKIGERQGNLVAGGHGQGNRLNQLDCPTFIFVDDEQSVYVSDRDNHRVMKWRKGAREGTVIAGGKSGGSHLSQLSSPQGIFVDKFGQTYVADTGNHRIMRWREGTQQGEIIVGGKGIGNRSNQLNSPIDLSFDDGGNLYVADLGNDRVQKFSLIYN
ncbi:unnamed protein product [Adineta ricciae]|uniref:Peptidase C14A caspase catalytic domain-containing protein n=1 Tax=Adineta ricciae TaxID=249248 RepID=A0A815SLL8_ADIRI|nr:unnamed protein product [Adineta ricciae]CAF1492355.1 unnamed protein product [Adineta ricciae]